MAELLPPFPPMPAGSNQAIIKPSPAFKKQVYKAIGAIILFILVYLLLVACALALAAGSAYLGIAVLKAGLSWMGILFGIALIIAGILLVFFLVKFLFKRTRVDYSGMIEVKKEDQPALNDFIEKITTEIGSPRPKKIFFGSSVNAFVFNNSTFWSMFFPVRKNLHIGLGLVNSVNLSEFKAIMAHEFGHFSQRSMKFGSYVYNVNKVIYNLLFQNEGYNNILNTWGRMHSIFRLMAAINFYLIQGIQLILKMMYKVVNKTYMGLSRQMEYHADAISAYAAGSNQAISALSRIEIGDLCYQNTLNYLGAKLGEKKRAENLFEIHVEMIRQYAQKQRLALDESGLPLVDQQHANVTSDKVEPDDPWSSHPVTEDRVKHLQSLNLLTEPIAFSAWSVFENIEVLQKQLTDVVYANSPSSNDSALITTGEVNQDLAAALNAHLYDEVFRDYFDNRDINSFDVDAVVAGTAGTQSLTYDELFSDENCRLPAVVLKNQENMLVLEQIIGIRKDVRHFYYKAEKLSREQAENLKALIEKETVQADQRIKELDQQIFIFFYNHCKSDDEKAVLIAKYRELFSRQAEALDDRAMRNELLRVMKPVYTKMKPPQIRATVTDVYLKEKKIKPRLNAIVADEEWKKYISPKNLDALNIYLRTNWQYYMNPNYDENAIKVLNKAMTAYANIVNERLLLTIKDLLDFEAGILRENKA